MAGQDQTKCKRKSSQHIFLLYDYFRANVYLPVLLEGCLLRFARQMENLLRC